MIDNTLASFTQHNAVRKVIAPVESGVAGSYLASATALLMLSSKGVCTSLKLVPPVVVSLASCSPECL
jgi:hypothetical protein